MSRLLLLAVVAVVLVCAASAAASPKTYSCAVTPDPGSSSPGLVSLHVTGTVPMKTVPYLRIDGSQTWTSLHNQKGVIDDWTGRTDAELPAGTHFAEIINAPNGIVGSTVVASCFFTVT